MQKTDVKKIFATFKQHNPRPTTELSYSSTFELLVAVILSAQATDKSVNKASENLFKVANSPQTMLQLGETKLKTYIKSIGLSNAKAKNIIATCKMLMEQYNAIIPNSQEELMKLPGVGRKTANVILNTAFSQATMAVDTHIFRVAKRIGLASSNSVLGVEKQLLEIIPKAYLLHAHHWLLLHGRYTCVARKPKCSECIIVKWCEYDNKNL